MKSQILMTYPEFIRYMRYLADSGPDNRFFRKRLKIIAKEAFRHYDYDYSNCAAVAELESQVVDQLVSVHVIADTAQRRKGALSVQCVCNVLFANGESLSSEEAIGGLGDTAPKYLKERVRKYKNAQLTHIRNSRNGKRSDLYPKD